MIVYLDTSALVKLYVRERGSGAVRRQASAAEAADAVKLINFHEKQAKK